MNATAVGLFERTSDLRYALTHDSQVAYRVIEGPDGGPHDSVLMLSGTASMESMFEDRIGVRLLDGLAALGRLVVFDRRGIGLSDPPVDWDVDGSVRWCEDVEAVVSAAQLTRPVIVSSVGSGAAALVYGDRHAGDVSSLVFVEPAAWRVDVASIRQQLAGEMDSIERWCPSRSCEPGFREWFTHAGQLGASPRLAARAYHSTDEEVGAIERAARRVRIPTLVLRRPAHPLSPAAGDDPILALVDGAVRVELPGHDLLIFGGEIDALLAEVSKFVTGEWVLPAPEHVLAAVMFSDIVGSARRTSALGDEGWKRMLDAHDHISRSCVGRQGGTVVKTTGDGVLALFPSATSAVQAGIALRGALAQQGLDVRIGIHAGDVDRRDDDVSGIAVVIAARVMAHAGGGEVMVSEAVPPLVAGSHKPFVDRGSYELNGVPGSWRLLSASE